VPNVFSEFRVHISLFFAFALCDCQHIFFGDIFTCAQRSLPKRIYQKLGFAFHSFKQIRFACVNLCLHFLISDMINILHVLQIQLTLFLGFVLYNGVNIVLSNKIPKLIRRLACRFSSALTDLWLYLAVGDVISIFYEFHAHIMLLFACGLYKGTNIFFSRELLSIIHQIRFEIIDF